MLHEPGLAERLDAALGAAEAEIILARALDRFDGRIAMVSSFGADSAVLLHMLSRLDPATPVLLLDTQLLFPETLDYQRDLTARLGLTDVRRITPDERTDPDRSLHLRDTEACCALRKRAPLDAAIAPFAATITGRKRFQTGMRAEMPTFEASADGRIKVNPLAAWVPLQISRYLDQHDLPRHPLVAQGYPSIGCAPCTSRVAPGESPRAGRWRDENRDECGIHFGPGGHIERKAG